MPKILLLMSILLPLFANDWVEVAGRSNGDYLHYQKNSFAKNGSIISGKIGTTRSNGSVVENSVQINCKEITIAYGYAVIRSVGGGENYMDMSKNGWKFFTPVDSAERKLIKTVCSKYSK